MIAVVLACEVKAEPPVQVYLEEFEKAGAPYQIICWAPRSSSPIHQNPIGCIEFQYKKRDGSLKSRVFNYFRFRRFLIRKLKEIKPDKIVFIPTQAGVLLPKRFFRKNLGKYYFDYRDPGYENYQFYLRRVMNMVNHSFATAISSTGFLNVLAPSQKYILAHNAYLFEANGPRERQNHPVKNVVSIGTLRTPEFAINQITPFISDPRFMVHLYGTGDERTIVALKSFLQDNCVNNVVYHGRFRDEELPSIIESSDALLVYFLSKLDGLYHMPDRLYLGMQYATPMIGNADTYCSKYITDNGLGFALDPRQMDLDALYEYLSTIDLSKIYENSRRCLEQVRQDNEKWRESIQTFIKS